MGRFARGIMARASGGSVSLSRLWPGRTDRLIIAPHDLRTADATRAAEIYAGRFVFAGKIVTCHGRSVFDLEPPSEDWEAALLGFGWLRHLRAADTTLTRANARSLVDDWISNTRRKRAVGRRPDVLARRVISVVAGAAGARRHRRQILPALSARTGARNPLSALHAVGRRRRGAAPGADRVVLRLALPRQSGTTHPRRHAQALRRTAAANTPRWRPHIAQSRRADRAVDRPVTAAADFRGAQHCAAGRTAECNRSHDADAALLSARRWQLRAV